LFCFELDFQFSFFLAVVFGGGAGGLDLLLKFVLFCIYLFAGAGGEYLGQG
jgi:hypothetical protein